MSNSATESTPAKLNAGASAPVTFELETPLNATYDAETGALVLESSIMRRDEEGGNVHLRLHFNSDATHRFARMLKAVEDQLGITIGVQAPPPVQQ